MGGTTSSPSDMEVTCSGTLSVHQPWHWPHPLSWQRWAVVSWPTSPVAVSPGGESLSAGRSPRTCLSKSLRILVISSVCFCRGRNR